MIQEYLFTTKDNKSELENLDVPEKITKEITEIENNECLILSLTVDDESEESAKLLDSFNKEIYDTYKPTILSNESSDYFEKTLYPLVNVFERKLRKLLYMASALHSDSKSKKVISDLETKELIDIFNMLFTDDSFTRSVRILVNNKNKLLTKNNLIEEIKNLDETFLWDDLIGGEYVKTLRKHYNEAKDFRNDVMHAHNINYEAFTSARVLFNKINSELDLAINELIGTKENNKDIVKPDFNEKIDAALKELSTIQALNNPELMSSLSQFNRLGFTPEAISAFSSIGKALSSQNIISSATSTLNKVGKNSALNQINISPLYANLQQSLKGTNFSTLSQASDSSEQDEEGESDE